MIVVSVIHLLQHSRKQNEKANIIAKSSITFIPCQREMALRGLRALKVLRLLKAVRLELPSTARLTTETWGG